MATGFVSWGLDPKKQSVALMGECAHITRRQDGKPRSHGVFCFRQLQQHTSDALCPQVCKRRALCATLAPLRRRPARPRRLRRSTRRWRRRRQACPGGRQSCGGRRSSQVPCGGPSTGPSR